MAEITDCFVLKYAAPLKLIIILFRANEQRNAITFMKYPVGSCVHPLVMKIAFQENVVRTKQKQLPKNFQQLIFGFYQVFSCSFCTIAFQ